MCGKGAVGGDGDPAEHVALRAAIMQEERGEEPLHRVAIHIAGREVCSAAVRQDARGAAVDAVVRAADGAADEREDVARGVAQSAPEGEVEGRRGGVFEAEARVEVEPIVAKRLCADVVRIAQVEVLQGQVEREVERAASVGVG